MQTYFAAFWTNSYYGESPPSYWYMDTLVTISTNEPMYS
jgi:hypothetical protein